MSNFKVGQVVRFIRETWEAGEHAAVLPPLYSLGEITWVERSLHAGPSIWVHFPGSEDEVGFTADELEIVEVIADEE